MNIRIVAIAWAALTGLLAICPAGCRKQEAQQPASNKPVVYDVGILKAQRDGDGVVLTVVLKDEATMVFFYGEDRGDQFWTRCDTPTDMRITLNNKKLKITSNHITSESAIEAAGVRLETTFPELPHGTKEIKIGAMTWKNNEVPILVKLLPATPGEKAKINEEHNASSQPSNKAK